MTVFILQNQHNQFLSKDNEWVNSGEAGALFRSSHYDVALNQLIEINSKDHSLRGAVVACELDSKGRPQINVESADPAESPDPVDLKPADRESEAESVAEAPDAPTAPATAEPSACTAGAEPGTTAAHA